LWANKEQRLRRLNHTDDLETLMNLSFLITLFRAQQERFFQHVARPLTGNVEILQFIIIQETPRQQKMTINQIIYLYDV